MLISVRLIGALGKGALREVKINLAEGSSVENLLNELSETYPQLAGIRSAISILVVVNGIEAGNLQGLATTLTDGSEVALVPVAHGG